MIPLGYEGGESRFASLARELVLLKYIKGGKSIDHGLGKA